MNSEEFPQFPELASNLSEQMTNSIFTDHVLYSYENGQDVYDLIHDHVSNNLIKVGKGLYRQIVGIPQGSILSTLLCSLFYGHFESECLAHLQLNEDGVWLFEFAAN
jgi:telomerase reverse transcriptase